MKTEAQKLARQIREDHYRPVATAAISPARKQSMSPGKPFVVDQEYLCHFVWNAEQRRLEYAANGEPVPQFPSTFVGIMNGIAS